MADDDKPGGPASAACALGKEPIAAAAKRKRKHERVVGRTIPPAG